MKQVTCIVRERQLRLCGLVARLLAEDPAHRILTCRNPSDWTMQSASKSFTIASGSALCEGYWQGGPGVCLGHGQTEAYLKDMGMTGLPPAWAMARRTLI